MHGGEPHAAAAADFLGGEERLEHALEHVRRDARAGVGDGQLDELADEALAAARADGAHGVRRPHRHREVPALAHGVARVDREVEQHLVELHRIQQHARVRRKVGAHLERRRDRAAHQLG